MRKANKRGSTLVVAVFLLLFALMMGLGLLSWGMHSVQTTVSMRNAQQAYYTAKSVTDGAVEMFLQVYAEAADPARKKEVDNALKGVALQKPLVGFALKSVAGLPADSAAAPLVDTSVVCTERPVDIANGTQSFLVSTTATYHGLQRTVARAFSVTRIPSTYAPTILCGGYAQQQERAGKTAVLQNARIFGGVSLQAAAQISLLEACVLEAPVFLASDNVNTALAASAQIGATGKGEVIIDAQSYTDAGDGSFGALTVRAPNYTLDENPKRFDSLTVQPNRVPLVDHPYRLNPLVAPNRVIPATGYRNIRAGGRIVGAGGRPFAVPQLVVHTQNAADVINIQVVNPASFSQIACDGGGTVNLFWDTPGEVAILENIYARGGTKVNLVATDAAAGIVTQDHVLHANLILPNGNVSLTHGGLEGFLWAASMQLTDCVITPLGCDASGAVPGLIAADLVQHGDDGIATAAAGKYQKPY